MRWKLREQKRPLPQKHLPDGQEQLQPLSRELCLRLEALRTFCTVPNENKQ
jgi:hypothetical protein